MTKRGKIFLWGGVAALLFVAALGGGAWYFFIRDDAPPAVSLSGALDELDERSATPTGTATTGATSTPTAEPTSEASPTDVTASEGVGLDGAWSIDPSLESFVGYRVQEELASIGATTAVGRTPAVEAALTIEDGVLTAASVDADLTQLESDQSRRDNALRNQGLETAQFPTATFVLTEPLTLPEGLEAGEAVQLTLVGELTLHGVTQPVEVPVEAQLADGVIAAIGSLEIQFADYNMDTPRAASVLSVEDHGVMEMQLFLQPS
jgi:polyisoprenoid-binding protein YceI